VLLEHPFFVGARFFAVCADVRAYSFAPRGKHNCHFFVTEQRNGERKSAKGSNTPWIPAAQKGRGAISALPKWALCSSFCGTKQIQTLRWRFDEKPISASRNHKFAC
jgi:hypothetical protein